MAAKKKTEPKPPKSTAAPQSAAAAEHSATGSSRRKVQELPGIVGDGVATPKVEALDDAIADYLPARDKRIAAGVEEKKNKVLIIALMKKHNIGSYEYDDHVVVVEPKDITDSLKVVAKADYDGSNDAD